jgi:hypothetical protein
MTDEKRKKTMHINLTGDQVDDYELCRTYTGIMNDNDLVRFLFRQAARQAATLPMFAPPEQERE